jgi:hypothetical protein
MGWQPPAALDRMVLAAALEKLTGAYDEVSARQVIVGFYSLPSTSEGRYKANVVYRDRCEAVDENGVAIDISSDKQYHLGRAAEEKMAHIGRFTVFKTHDTFPDCPGIVFGDFREGTREELMSEPLPKWALAFHQPTLEPLVLVRIDYVPAVPDLWQKLQHLWLVLRTGIVSQRCTYWEQAPTLLWVRKA